MTAHKMGSGLQGGRRERRESIWNSGTQEKRGVGVQGSKGTNGGLTAEARRTQRTARINLEPRKREGAVQQAVALCARRGNGIIL